MLRGFFDESGTHGAANATVIAGYVGSDKEWKSVSIQWKEVLDVNGIQSFHMADAIAQRRQFASIRAAIVQDMCRALGRILIASDLEAVWSGVQSKVWNAATTEDFRAAFPKPYDLCVMEIMRQLRALARRRHYQGKISLVFAAQDEYQRRAEEALVVWSRHGSRNIGPLEFASAAQRPILQAADMLSHELYVSLNDFAKGDIKSGTLRVSPLLDAASRGDLGSGAFITESALRLRVANRDWVDPYFFCPSDTST